VHFHDRPLGKFLRDIGRGIALALIAGAPVVFTGCTPKGDDRDETARRECFRTVMTFAAPAAVSDVRSAFCRSRDRNTRWLRFIGDDATLARVRSLGGGGSNETGFTYLHGSHRPGGRDGADPDAPLWWNEADAPPDMKQITFGQLQKGKTSVPTDIWIDEKKRTVYARRIELN
jgi:hypothetical protein